MPAVLPEAFMCDLQLSFHDKYVSFGMEKTCSADFASIIKPIRVADKPERVLLVCHFLLDGSECFCSHTSK